MLHYSKQNIHTYNQRPNQARGMQAQVMSSLKSKRRTPICANADAIGHPSMCCYNTTIIHFPKEMPTSPSPKHNATQKPEFPRG
jgi:hypothetical protein